MSKKSEMDEAFAEYERAVALGYRYLGGVADWVLDLAAHRSNDDEENLDAVENVRDYVRGLFEGGRSTPPFGDVFTVIAILIEALDIEVPIERVPVRFPGAPSGREPTEQSRRFPGRRRNACGAGAYLAA
jgi:hypothetical protein